MVDGVCVYSDVEGTAPECTHVCKVCKYWVAADLDDITSCYCVDDEDVFPEEKPAPEYFNGECKIMVRFKNNAEYLKFRKYVLKTDWESDTIPSMYTLKLEYHTVEQLESTMRKIIYLMQMGFDVHSANWKLATETSPIIERKE